MPEFATNDAAIPVSVVIPCYRCAATIKRAVQSVARQNFRPFELILVDDASGDGTAVVLREIVQVYPDWVRIVQLTENGGAARARNAGWAVASQPYVAFLDADDAWHPDKLGIQYEYMRSNPDVALSGHQCASLRDGEACSKFPSSREVTRIRPVSLVFKSCFSTPTVMLKRDLLFRFPENKRYSEDLNLWQQIAFAGLPVTRLESPLAYIYKAPYGEGGLSSRLWDMEKGELQNIAELRRGGKIALLLYIAAVIFSVAKYFKRLLRVRLERVTG